jgi:alpha-aminoadipic semialdehyde synthase
MENSMITSNTDPTPTICIGILREIKSPWERRVALTPNGCRNLLELGFRIIVQPSKIRCFSDDEYQEIGCEVKEDLSECSLIVGLQDPDLNALLPEKTYTIFSHCKKGKTENQNLLEKMLEKKIRLIDYECIKEDLEDRSKAKRLVSFGKIAGIAGTINLFKGIGELLLARQVSTPFVFTKLAYMYPDVADAEKSLHTLGDYLISQYLPEEYSSFTIAVLGNGRVSQGVQEALKCLPNKFLTPRELILGNYEKRRDTIYVVVFESKDLYVKTEKFEKSKTDSGNGTISLCDFSLEFDKNDFIKNPENYTSIFDTYYLSYFHAIINCLYWESRHPRILTKKSLKNHVTKHDIKLIGISDISCDINGPIEILKEYNTFRKPFSIYEPVSEKQIEHVDSATKEGIIYHAIPNLAACFSVDASEYFNQLVLPYIRNLAYSQYPIRFEDQNDLLNELKNACICSNGVLTPRYRNIFRNTEEKSKVEATNKEQGNKPYFISLKIKGSIFDSGFFTIIIDRFPEYRVGHKIVFLSIGEGPDMPSILYLDIYGQTIDDIKAFMGLVKQKVDEFKLEFDVLKSNIN